MLARSFLSPYPLLPEMTAVCVVAALSCSHEVSFFFSFPGFDFLTEKHIGMAIGMASFVGSVRRIGLNNIIIQFMISLFKLPSLVALQPVLCRTLEFFFFLVICGFCLFVSC